MIDEYAGEVQAIVDRVLGTPDAAVEETEVAAPEAATEETDTAAVTEDESASDKAAEESTEAKEDEEEEAPDAESAETTEAEPSDESFQTLLEDIPSKETIDAQFNRVPQAGRDEMYRLADLAREKNAKLDTIGGEEGADIFAPVHELLTKPVRDVEDHRKALTAVFTTNPLATTEMLAAGALDILFPVGDNPQIKEMARTGDFVLQTRFGEGATSEHIETLLMLEKNGFFDAKEGLEYLNAEGNASQLFQSQATTIEQLEAERDQLKHLVAHPELIDKHSQQQSNAVKDLDTELVTRLTDGIKPFREKMRWADDSALAKTTMDAILAELRADPAYRDAVEFAVQNGSLKQGETIPHTISQKLYSLINVGKARFAERGASINNELRTRTETSRNAKQAEKVEKETKPRSVATQPSPQYFDGAIDMDPDLAALYRKHGIGV